MEHCFRVWAAAHQLVYILQGISAGMLPPPPLVSALTSALCIGITVWTYLSNGSITAALAVASFAVLSLQLLAVEKPHFSQMTSSVFGLFYCGAHISRLCWALHVCCPELAAGQPRSSQTSLCTVCLFHCSLCTGNVLRYGAGCSCFSWSRKYTGYQSCLAVWHHSASMGFGFRVANTRLELTHPPPGCATGYLPSFWVKLRVLAVPALSSTAVHNWPVSWQLPLRSCHRDCTALFGPPFHKSLAQRACQSWVAAVLLTHGVPCVQ